jgi:hypothetical protein
VVRVPKRAEAGIASAAGVGTLVERGCGICRSGEAGWFGSGASSTGEARFTSKGDVCFRGFRPDCHTRFFPVEFSGIFSGELDASYFRPRWRPGGSG